MKAVSTDKHDKAQPTSHASHGAACSVATTLSHATQAEPTSSVTSNVRPSQSSIRPAKTKSQPQEQVCSKTTYQFENGSEGLPGSELEAEALAFELAEAQQRQTAQSPTQAHSIKANHPQSQMGSLSQTKVQPQVKPQSQQTQSLNQALAQDQGLALGTVNHQTQSGDEHVAMAPEQQVVASANVEVPAVGACSSAQPKDANVLASINSVHNAGGDADAKMSRASKSGLMPPVVLPTEAMQIKTSQAVKGQAETVQLGAAMASLVQTTVADKADSADHVDAMETVAGGAAVATVTLLPGESIPSRARVTVSVQELNEATAAVHQLAARENLHYVVVDTDEQLAQVCLAISQAQESDFISLDTEFMRISSYYPDFSLMQLALGGEIYLVDVVRLHSIDKIIYALSNTLASVLVFAGAEDLELLTREARRIGCERLLPLKLYDLQIMLAFCGHSYGRGLSFALQEFLGVTLAKEFTRTNWNIRPLAEEQLIYGALDVFYLERLYQELKAHIPESNFRYFTQEMEFFKNHYVAELQEEDAYLNIPAAGMLSDKELNILQYLAKQRIIFARQENVALNRIITTKSMWRVAKFQPKSKKELERNGVKSNTVSEYGDLILQWLAQAKQAPRYEHLQLPYDYFSHQRSMQENFDALKQVIKRKLSRNKICSQVLLRKQLLNDYFRSKVLGQTPLLQQSWRLELLGRLDIPTTPLVKAPSHSSGSDAALMDHMAEELCMTTTGVVHVRKPAIK